MKLDISMPEYRLAEGAEASTDKVEEAVQEALAEATRHYNNKVSTCKAAVESVAATPKAQDGGATIFMIAATAFVTGLSTELGKEAAREIADYARRWLKHRKGALLEEAEDTSAKA